MICSECEQLFDAYLDGQLAGSLRLEFDAHRLRCRPCQQTLAMLEAVGHVISSDNEAPALAEDFTDRVMRQVDQPQPRIVRWPLPRVAVVVGALAQVAAVLVFALVWFTGPPTPPPEPMPALPAAGEPQPVFAFLIERVSDMCRGAGAEVAELRSALHVPVARQPAPTDRAGEESPLGVLFDLLIAAPPPAPPAATHGEHVLSI